MTYLWLGLVVGLVETPESRTAPPAGRPNILLIVGDDLGYADVGFHGCKDIPTPHLDALAKSGVRFTSGYVSGPYCSPTRAGLLTGRYQTRFGHEFNPGSDRGQGLPLSEVTLADQLRNAGYRTGLIGKWHLGNNDRHPMKRGFESFFGFLGGAHDYFRAEGILRGTEPAKSSGYLTDTLATEALAFLDTDRDRPFFLMLAFNAVHTPMQADEARKQKLSSIADPKRRTYGAMMSAMDDAVGTVLKKVGELGKREETLVAFLSDNGGPTMRGVTVNGSTNTPFRGSKRTTLEGGIRVPFLVSWPGTLPAGRVEDRPVIQLDLHATALAAAGISNQSGAKGEGVNLLPYLKGKEAGSPHDALYWRFGKQMAIRQGDWKLVRYDQAAEGGSGLSPARLYDLKSDPGESKDLASTHPEKVKAMQSAWEAWNASNIPPLWGAPGPVK